MHDKKKGLRNVCIITIIFLSLFVVVRIGLLEIRDHSRVNEQQLLDKVSESLLSQHADRSGSSVVNQIINRVRGICCFYIEGVYATIPPHYLVDIYIKDEDSEIYYTRVQISSDMDGHVVFFRKLHSREDRILLERVTDVPWKSIMTR